MSAAGKRKNSLDSIWSVAEEIFFRGLGLEVASSLQEILPKLLKTIFSWFWKKIW